MILVELEPNFSSGIRERLDLHDLNIVGGIILQWNLKIDVGI
jgi:hypothetical protein